MKNYLLISFLLFSISNIFPQWTQKTSPVPFTVNGISFPTSSTGFINDSKGNFSKTTDGGFTWSEYKHITDLNTYSNCFFDESKGFIAADNGSLLKTTDGGETWTVVSFNTSSRLSKIAFQTGALAFVIGEKGFYARTDDGGKTWIAQAPFTTKNLTGLTFPDSLEGYISSEDAVYHTMYQGFGWDKMSITGYTGSIKDISSAGYAGIFAIGDYGSIYKRNYSGWKKLTTITNSSLNLIKFIDEQNGYILGSFGAILATTDAGTTWISQNNGLNNYVSASFINNSLAFIGGDDETSAGILLNTFNGGFPSAGLKLGTPNESEILYTGDTYPITWSSQKCEYLNIDYTTDFGVSWINIISGYPSALNCYPWTVPSTPFYNCKVRITDASDPQIADTSDNSFRIVAIKVLSPNGGESWQAKTTHTIKWKSTQAGQVDIYYSPNEGYLYNLVASNIENTGSYEWILPDTSSNKCKIKIVAKEPGSEDQSDAFFAITRDPLYAKITADTLCFDTEYKGYIEKQVSAELSVGSHLTYGWIVNDTSFYSEISPVVKLHSGLNKLLLNVTDISSTSCQDTAYVNVIAAKVAMGGAISSGLSEYNGRYYLTSDDNGVYETDSTGAKLNSFLTGGSIRSVLAISNSGKLFTGSSDHLLYSLNTELKTIWDKDAGGSVEYTPAISGDGNTVYCPTNNGKLSAFDIQTGELKWTFEPEGTITSSPVVLVDDKNKDIVYAGTSSGYLYAIKDNKTSGELFWRKQLADTVFSSVALLYNNQNTMLFAASKGGYLYRIKWDGTANDDWQVNINSPVYCSPVIDGYNTIYIAAKNGFMYAYPVDFNTGTAPLFYYIMDSGVIGTPAIGRNGNIYAGTENGTLYSFSKTSKSFSLLWKSKLYSPIISSALVSEGGNVYIGTATGDLVVIKEPLTSFKENTPIWPTYMGNNQRSRVLSINITGTENSEKVITSYDLMQNYPNPFNPTTVIQYQVPALSRVKLELYSITGERIAVLVDKEQSAGIYKIETGRSLNLATGVYIYRMTASGDKGTFTSVKKMMLIK